jgi:hypothetical protein
VTTNAPGSWHDARVAQPIYKKLLDCTPEGYYLVADTAFPRGTGDIAGRIRAPVKAGQRIEGTEEEIAEAMAFNRELLSYRQSAEWGNRQLQGTFGRLRLPLDINDPEQRGDLLEVCFRLFNLCMRRIGINQIRSVYLPIWFENNNEERIWQDFGDMLFSEQRKNDCVARFHTYAEFQ